MKSKELYNAIYEAQMNSITAYDEELAYSTEMKTGDGLTAEDNSDDWSAVCDIFHITEY